ncbi:alpha-defensin 20-like [Microtus ochrogaster]|uniref:Alpha-defensin 20-like n=1 Tax=Microtus ochrogaster TaxID=79684 RepID=A0ABM0LBA8_MICOH|nr:alpha-defensin 20-like [Microtus ochrogaster]
MKTPVLLSVLVLLAFQAQADPLPEAAEETKTEEQPGVEDQDVSISFGDPEGSSLQDAARRGVLTCSCRNHCERSEHVYGICNRRNLFCCR